MNAIVKELKRLLAKYFEVMVVDMPLLGIARTTKEQVALSTPIRLDNQKPGYPHNHNHDYYFGSYYSSSYTLNPI